MALIFKISLYNYNKPLKKVCDNKKMGVAPQLRYLGVEALAGQQ